MFYERARSSYISKLFEHFPIVIITGARQVGKSSLLLRLFGDRARHVVFDPITDVGGARADPELFLRTSPPPLILDEIQYVPELVPALKRRIDEDKRPGRYLITGSQQWEVMKNLAESLAGRGVLLDLDSFSLAETANLYASSPGYEPWAVRWLTHGELPSTQAFRRINLPFPLFEQLWRGSLPEAQFLDRAVLSPYYESYVRTYLERDVRLLSEGLDLQLFRRFYQLVAALTAQEINFSELGRDLGVDYKTAQRWLSILRATFQWYELQPFLRNTVKRISKKPKGYIAELGILCQVLAISSPDTIAGHPLWGAIFETAAVRELMKQLSTLSPQPALAYWRVHSGPEVDLLIEYNGSFYPVEVKSKSRPTKNDATGIRAFRETFPDLRVETGVIIAPAEEPYWVTDDVVVVPWDAE